MSGSNTKAEAVIQCLSDKEVDLWRLRELALTEGGLLNNVIRRKAWPKLMGIDRFTDPNILDSQGAVSEKFVPDGSGTPNEAEMDQVQRDVTRCTWHLLTQQQRRIWKNDGMKRTGSFEDDDTPQSPSRRAKQKVAILLKKKQRRLGHLINMILQDAKGSLKYYQGYHDVSSVFLSVLGVDGLGITKAVLFKLSNSHFRDQMNETFFELTCALRLTIFPLLQRFDRPLHDYLVEAALEPFFALSWILTWFSHDLKDTSTATRLFDAFLVSHPILPIYVSIAMVTHPINRRMICKTECDFAEIHRVMCSLPKNTSSYGWRADGGYGSDEAMDDPLHETRRVLAPLVPVQELINNAIEYMRIIPPRSLIALAKKYNNGALQPYLQTANAISLFKNPPSWALNSTVFSDWYLKKESSERENSVGYGSPSRRSSTASVVDPLKFEEALRLAASKDEEEISQLHQVDVKELNIPKNNKDAHTAAGLGLDNDRRVKVISVLLLGGLVFASIYVTWSYFEENPSSHLSESKCLATSNQRRDYINKRLEPNAVSLSNFETMRFLSGVSTQSRHSLFESALTHGWKNPFKNSARSDNSMLFPNTNINKHQAALLTAYAEEVMNECLSNEISPNGNSPQVLNGQWVNHFHPVNILRQLRPKLSWLKALQKGMANIIRIVNRDLPKVVNQDVPLD